MSERRRSAVALSSRAHAFSVEALIGSNKKRKLRDWEEKGLDLSMEALSPAGPLGDAEDAAAHGLEPHPGECVGPDRGRRGPAGGQSGEEAGPGRRRPALLQRGLLFLCANASSHLQIRRNQFGGTGLSRAFSSPTSSKEAFSLASPLGAKRGAPSAPQPKGCKAPGSVGRVEDRRRRPRRRGAGTRVRELAGTGARFSDGSDTPVYGNTKFIPSRFQHLPWLSPLPPTILGLKLLNFPSSATREYNWISTSFMERGMYARPLPLRPGSVFTSVYLRGAVRLICVSDPCILYEHNT